MPLVLCLTKGLRPDTCPYSVPEIVYHLACAQRPLARCSLQITAVQMTGTCTNDAKLQDVFNMKLSPRIKMLEPVPHIPCLLLRPKDCITQCNHALYGVYCPASLPSGLGSRVLSNCAAVLLCCHASAPACLLWVQYCGVQCCTVFCISVLRTLYSNVRLAVGYAVLLDNKFLNLQYCNIGLFSGLLFWSAFLCCSAQFYQLCINSCCADGPCAFWRLYPCAIVLLCLCWACLSVYHGCTRGCFLCPLDAPAGRLWSR